MAVKLKDLFDDETIQKAVEEALGDTHVIVEEKDYIPKAKFDAARDEIKTLKQQVSDRDDQIEALKKDTETTDDLKARIEELQEQNTQAQSEYEERLQGQKLDYEVEKALIAADAKNVKAVKALLDLDEVKLTDDGLKGLDAQLKELQESDSYLFGTSDLKGREPHKKKDPPPKTDNPWKPETRNLTEQGRLIREDPERARKLAAQAGVKLNI